MDRKMVYVASTVAGILLALTLHWVATGMRGYEAIGGEAVFITLPLWVWLTEMLMRERG